MAFETSLVSRDRQESQEREDKSVTGVGIAAVSRVKMHSVRCVVSNCGDKATLAPADSIAGHHRHSHTVNTGDTQSGALLLLLFTLFILLSCSSFSHCRFALYNSSSIF